MSPGHAHREVSGGGTVEDQLQRRVGEQAGGHAGVGTREDPGHGACLRVPDGKDQRPAGGSQHVERQADTVGRRLGGVVHRDACLAPRVKRRSVGKERGGVPVLPDAQQREIERRDAVRPRGDAPADLARVGARGLLRRAFGGNRVGDRFRCLEKRLGQQAVVRLGSSGGTRRSSPSHSSTLPSRRPGWPTAHTSRAWCPPPATRAPRGPGPGRRRSLRPAARPPGRWLAAGCR